jgi:hypothetical protein
MSLDSIRGYRLRLLAVIYVLLTLLSGAKPNSARGSQFLAMQVKQEQSPFATAPPSLPATCSNADIDSKEQGEPTAWETQPHDTGASSTRCMSIKAMKYTLSPAPDTTRATRWPHAGLNLWQGNVKRLGKRVLVIVAVSAVVAAAIAGIAYYWTFARFFVSTPDAYVQAVSTIVAARREVSQSRILAA